MPDATFRLPPLRAGRQTAGKALLGWLHDTRAPRLCKVTGSTGIGKSHLLAWMFLACSSPNAPKELRVHGFVPAGGLTLENIVWVLARQLGTYARTPGGLLAAIAADQRPTTLAIADLSSAGGPALPGEPLRIVDELLNPVLEFEHVRLVAETTAGSPEDQAFRTPHLPALLDLGYHRWTDWDKFARWCATLNASADPAAFYPSPGRARKAWADTPEPSPLAVLEEQPNALLQQALAAGTAEPLLADPQFLVHARPEAITTAFAALPKTPLSTAWQEAGPGLVDQSDPDVRAAVLHARLTGRNRSATDRLAPLLKDSGWRAGWAHWRTTGAGKPNESWPGAASALCSGRGPYAGLFLAADPSGTVRVLRSADGLPAGRTVMAGPVPTHSMSCTDSGTIFLIADTGGIDVAGVTDGDLAPTFAALDRLHWAARGRPTVLTCVPDSPGSFPVVADADGAVHWHDTGEEERPSDSLASLAVSDPSADGSGVRTVFAHHGPVTALASTALRTRTGGVVPLLVSGGADGTVRLWSPPAEPMAEALDEHGCPVTAVAADITPEGPIVAAAWTDGLIRVRRPAADSTVDIRLGSPVLSLAFAAGGMLVVGLPDGIVGITL